MGGWIDEWVDKKKINTKYLAQIIGRVEIWTPFCIVSKLKVLGPMIWLSWLKVLATQAWQPMFRSRAYENVEGANQLHKVLLFVLCLIHAYPQAHNNKYTHCIYTQKLMLARWQSLDGAGNKILLTGVVRHCALSRLRLLPMFPLMSRQLLVGFPLCSERWHSSSYTRIQGQWGPLITPRSWGM